MGAGIGSHVGRGDTSKAQDPAPLKLLPLCILQVLDEETNDETTLTAADIRRKVNDRFSLKVERKTMERNLKLLKEFDERVQNSISLRRASGESASSGWYREPLLSRSELRFLADMIVCSLSMPTHQKKQLWNKLRSLAGLKERAFAWPENPSVTEARRAVDSNLLLNLEIIYEALASGRCVSFVLGYFELDGTLRRDPSDELMTVEPVWTAVRDGRHYLAARFKNKEKLYHFRIDMMLNTQVDKSKSTQKAGTPGEADMMKYLAEHPLMYSDPVVRVTLRALDTHKNRYHLFEQFGSLATLKEDPDKKHLLATVSGNEEAICHWALQYSDAVEVVEPQAIRDKLWERGRAIAKMYQERYGSA